MYIRLALLKVSTTGPLPSVAFGDSSRVRPSDAVIANRDISETPFDGYIQVNADGQLIGVNSAFFSPTGAGGSVGLGFAVPSNDVAWTVGETCDSHGVYPGATDIEVQTVSGEIANAYDRTEPGGTGC